MKLPSRTDILNCCIGDSGGAALRLLYDFALVRDQVSFRRAVETRRAVRISVSCRRGPMRRQNDVMATRRGYDGMTGAPFGVRPRSMP